MTKVITERMRKTMPEACRRAARRTCAECKTCGGDGVVPSQPMPTALALSMVSCHRVLAPSAMRPVHLLCPDCGPDKVVVNLDDFCRSTVPFQRDPYPQDHTYGVPSNAATEKLGRPVLITEVHHACPECYTTYLSRYKTKCSVHS